MDKEYTHPGFSFGMSVSLTKPASSTTAGGTECIPEFVPDGGKLREFCLRIGCGTGRGRLSWSRGGRRLYYRNIIQRPAGMSCGGGDPAIVGACPDHPPGAIRVAADQWEVGSLHEGSSLVIVRAGTAAAVGAHIRYKECAAGCG